MILGGVIISRISIPAPEKRRLAGRTTVDGSPEKRRVVIHSRGTNEYVASTLSNSATGQWEIRGMPVFPERSLVATAFDDTGQYNAEILDFVSQVE